MVWHDISRYGMFYVHPHKLPGSSRTQEAQSGKCMGNAMFSENSRGETTWRSPWNRTENTVVKPPFLQFRPFVRLIFSRLGCFLLIWETQVGEIFHTSTNNFWGINWKERWCSHFATHLLFCYDNDLKHEASHLQRPRLAHETASSAAREVMNHVPWRSVTKPKPKPAELKRKGYHLRWFTIWMTRISRIPVDHPFEPMILPLFLYLLGRMPQIKPSCQVRLRVKFSSRIVYNSSNKINSMIIMIVIKIVYK